MQLKFGYRRVILALAIAGISDLISAIVSIPAPPVQFAIDVATALALYAVLGFQPWLLVPLMLEAIPTVGVAPWWILVAAPLCFFGRLPAGRGEQTPAPKP